jgi:hypothetical protein
MTGKITVGTIQDTDGNTVASTYVTNGVAKCIFSVSYDGTAIYDTSGGINTSSLTDNGTGDRTISWTNNITSRTYNCAFDNTGWTNDVYDRTAQVYHNFSLNPFQPAMETRTGMLTSSVRFISFYEGPTGAVYDYANYGVVHGDLA